MCVGRTRSKPSRACEKTLTLHGVRPGAGVAMGAARVLALSLKCRAVRVPGALRRHPGPGPPVVGHRHRLPSVLAIGAQECLTAEAIRLPPYSTRPALRVAGARHGVGTELIVVHAPAAALRSESPFSPRDKGRTVQAASRRHMTLLSGSAPEVQDHGSHPRPPLSPLPATMRGMRFVRGMTRHGGSRRSLRASEPGTGGAGVKTPCGLRTGG